MPLSEAPDRSPEREPPRTVGEAIDMIEAVLVLYPRICQTQFVGDAWWNIFCRNRGKLLSDMYSDNRFENSVPFRFFFGQYLVGFVCRNLLTELANGKVCLTPAIGRIPEIRYASLQDSVEITHAIQFILGFAQIDLGLPVAVRSDTGMPFVPSSHTSTGN